MSSLIFLGKESWFHYVVQVDLDQKDPDSAGIIGEALCSYLEHSVRVENNYDDTALILRSLEMIGINTQMGVYDEDLISTTAWWFRDVKGTVLPILNSLLPPNGWLEIKPIVWSFPEGPALHALECLPRHY